MDFSFGKEYKLCSLKQIAQLFKEGKRIREFPFQFVIHEANHEKTAFQIVVSVSKRNFKHAHDRNLVKRRMREIVRINKAILEKKLQEQDKQLNIAVIYAHREILDFQQMERKLIKGLHKLTQQND